MATLTVKTMTAGLSGDTYGGTDPLTPAYAACTAGGDQFLIGNQRKMFIHIKNGHSSPQTVTIASVRNCNMGHDHNIAVAVPNAGERMIPICVPKEDIADASGYCQLTYSGVTLLTIKVFELAENSRG